MDEPLSLWKIPIRRLLSAEPLQAAGEASEGLHQDDGGAGGDAFRALFFATGGCDIHPLKTVVSLGKLTKNYGKSWKITIFMGKSHILTGPFSIAMEMFTRG